VAEFDAAGAKLRFVKSDLAGAEVHGPLAFGFGFGHALFEGVKELCAIVARSLAEPVEARRVAKEEAIATGA
jgi:hypothetical protein